MSVTLKCQRQIAALIQPFTGDRSSTTLQLVSTDPSVIVPVNTHLIPIVRSATGMAQIAPELVFRTAAEVTVTPAGAPVAATSVVGGVQHNLPVGTTFRFHPEVPGMVQTSDAIAPVIGATTVSGLAAIRRVVYYEQIRASQASKDFFLAKAGDFPAVVICWESTGPGEQIGPKHNLRPDRWSLHVVVSRGDDGALRAGDGLEILDAVEDTIQDRAYIDGEAFTSKMLQVTGRTRLLVSDSSYVYTLQATTWMGRKQRVPPENAAARSAWVKTKYNLTTTPPDLALNPSSLEIVDGATYNQAQPPPPFPP